MSTKDSPPGAPTQKRLPRIVRIMKLRPGLFIAAAVALAVSAVLFATCPDWRASTKLLFAWDAALLLYLAIVARLMARADHNRIRSRAALQDEGGLALLILPVMAAAASLVALFAELSIAKGSGSPAFHVTLTILTITLSWTFIHTLFALHYAHDFYGEGERANGLEFPGKDKPDYWDFVYFSFVVGMTFQVSDVQVTNRLIRRLVVAHGVLSFLFNTAIVAVTVNLATSAI